MEGSSEFTIDSTNNLLEELNRYQERFFFYKKEVVEVTRESVKSFVREICQDIARLMNCERVEVWLFNDGQTTLTTEISYDRTRTCDPIKNVLRKHEAPSYFEAVVSNRTLAIEDVSKSPIMKKLRDCLPNEYHGVESILDASIMLSGGVGGIVCCLSYTKQQWTLVHKHALSTVANMLAFVYDRLHKQETENYIYDLAYSDVLTELNNEHAFYKLVSKEIVNYPKGQKGIFMYMIIDQFTDIQGVLGYKGADEVLRTIAKRLRETLPEPAIIARRAFDHFLIYSPIKLSQEQINEWKNKLTRTLKEPMKINDKEVKITFSYGVSYFPHDVTDASEGVQAAQVALESELKKNTRKARGFFHSNMRAIMQESLYCEMDLRRGLDLNQFRLFYQPQVHCRTGEVLGFEALLRWDHPEKGLVFPADVITVAESTGLITTIDHWVVREAIEQLGRFAMVGKGHLKISINMSPDYFLYSDLPNYLRQCTKDFNVKPEQLIIEITESIALSDRCAVSNRMKELHELGFSISIDDFGTGYSAFVYLQDYLIQEIKIDRQFIQAIEGSPKSEAIMNSIVQIGRELGLKTVAEGVETIGEWKKIQAMGCDEIQGFYFSKPLPIEEIEEMMIDLKPSEPFYLPK